VRTILFSAGLLCALSCAAQQKTKPGLTAGQIIEKSIAATGGRVAMEQVTSLVSKGLMGTSAGELRNAVEFCSKAPSKRLIVMFFEGVGEMRQGFDGKVAWNQMPLEEAVEVTGAQLAGVKRDAVFNPALKWRELFPKAELRDVEKAGDRQVYPIVLTPSTGKPLTQYYDTQTFLLVRQSGNFETPQGPMDIGVEFSDYRDIGGGVKAPFRIRQVTPMGEVIMKITEMKVNVEIDDAKFAKPAHKNP
jgi:zinc protease